MKSFLKVVITKEVNYRTRSYKLRNAAIEYYKSNDKICCQICSFDFEKVYGDLGKGFIEIHHIKPIYQFDSTDNEKFMSQAIKNLIPVCSNCHRMIHRKKDIKPIELLKIIDTNKKIDR